MVNGGSNYDSLNGAFASIESTADVTMTLLVLHSNGTSIESIVMPVKDDIVLES